MSDKLKLESSSEIYSLTYTKNKTHSIHISDSVVQIIYFRLFSDEEFEEIPPDQRPPLTMTINGDDIGELYKVLGEALELEENLRD